MEMFRFLILIVNFAFGSWLLYEGNMAGFANLYVTHYMLQG